MARLIQVIEVDVRRGPTGGRVVKEYWSAEDKYGLKLAEHDPIAGDSPGDTVQRLEAELARAKQEIRTTFEAGDRQAKAERQRADELLTALHAHKEEIAALKAAAARDRKARR